MQAGPYKNRFASGGRGSPDKPGPGVQCDRISCARGNHGYDGLNHGLRNSFNRKKVVGVSEGAPGAAKGHNLFGIRI